MVSPPRLKKRAQFLKAARRGRKSVFAGLVAQALPAEPGEDGFLAGFTVTKKVGNSVVRNRTKRRLREALRLVAREELLPEGVLVLIGRATTRTRPFASLQDDVRSALGKLAKANAAVAAVRAAAEKPEHSPE